jgi:hypothetical protein
MEYWMSPNPVDMFKIGDFYDIVGNVWQHTITPLYPFGNFEIHPAYEDFSTPVFDERHNVIKGGSFLATGNEALSSTRQNFRRHFYQFCGFRYIESDIEMEVETHCEAVISDCNVEMNLKHHYCNNDSYVLEVVKKVTEIAESKPNRRKALTVGCSVGRIPMELGKIYKESVGIDYNTRYFQMSSRLKETGCLKFKDIDIDLKNLDIKYQNVALMAMNPENPDENKVNLCDLVIVDGYAIKKGTIKDVISHVIKLTTPDATVVLLNVQGLNDIPQ